MKVTSYEAIVRTLNDSRVPFIVVSGLAVVAHGYGRNTFDVDLVIQLQEDCIKRAFAALERIDYRPAVRVTAEEFSDPKLREKLRVSKNMEVLKFWSELHLETPLDVFVTEPFDFQEEYDLAIEQESLPGYSARIVRYETLLAMKRAIGRPQDLADISELRFIKEGKYSDG
jgi:predicted nucleotidyltransferase